MQVRAAAAASHKARLTCQLVTGLLKYQLCKYQSNIVSVRSSLTKKGSVRFAQVLCLKRYTYNVLHFCIDHVRMQEPESNVNYS